MPAKRLTKGEHRVGRRLHDLAAERLITSGKDILTPHARGIRTGLLACGVAYGVTTIVSNDVIAARIFHGFSRLNQAISELSGTKAPSKEFLTAMNPIFSLLVIGFGVGVWKAAEGNRALRAAGDLCRPGCALPALAVFPDDLA